MKNKTAPFAIGSVMLFALALAFGACNALSEGAGLRANTDTIWIRLAPTALYEVDGGTTTATLTLDFNRVIDALEGNPSEEALAELITFSYENYPAGTPPSGKLKATKVVKQAEAIYIVTVKNVPPTGGIARVTVNKSGLTPPYRPWSLNGQVLPDGDDTAALLDFRFEPSKNQTLSAEAIGGIDWRQGTVFVVAPEGTPLSPLNPSIITNLGNTYTPQTQSNFVGIVPYKLTSSKTQDEKEYEVRVVQQTQSSAQIYVFGFTKEENAAFLTGSLSGIINEAAKTITVTAPYGTDLRTLKPHITHSGKTISPANLAVRDFTNPVRYTVTSINGARVDYVVSVSEGLNPSGANLFETTWVPQGEPKDISAYSGGVVERALAWLNDTTVTGGALAGRQFEIRLDGDEAVGPQTLGGAAADAGETALPNIKGRDRFNVGLTIKSREGSTGSPTVLTLSLSGTGSMLRLASGAYVDMAIDNLILKGLSAGHLAYKLADAAPFTIDIPASDPAVDNNRALVYVGLGNVFEMLGSAELTGNWNTVNVHSDVDHASYGGGAQVFGGTFRMTGDHTSVHHNYAAGDNSYWSGGGISCGDDLNWVRDRTNEKVIISGDYAEVSYNASGSIGGVHVGIGAYFELSGGHAKVHWNQAGGSTAGVLVGGDSSTRATGVMSGANAEISHNYSSHPSNDDSNGGSGGLYVSTASFYMRGGEIAENTCVKVGGVRSDGDFVLEGGTIRANTGGGVFAHLSNGFTMKGGVVYGTDAQDQARINTAYAVRVNVSASWPTGSTGYVDFGSTTGIPGPYAFLVGDTVSTVRVTTP
jgi:hypothetical protein